MRVAVLQGGRSLERGVSLRSGAHVQEALRRAGHEALPIDAGPQLVAQLRAQAPDVAFVALHGSDGENGTVQRLLELLDIPYTGSGPSACVRATDKALAKHLLGEAGIPTPEFHSFAEDALEQLGLADALPELERSPGFPLVVKPAHGGSAFGVTFAADAAELPRALIAAFSYDYDDRVVVERYVQGRDLAVSVLEVEGPAAAAPGAESPTGSARKRAAPEPVALPIVEAIPREQDFYAYESRYEIGMTTFVCPAELPAEIAARTQEVALATYRLLGCHGVARIDLMLAEGSEEPTVLEANVVPGLTETSLLPQAADAAGIGFDALIERILQSAFTR